MPVTSVTPVPGYPVAPHVAVDAFGLRPLVKTPRYTAINQPVSHSATGGGAANVRTTFFSHRAEAPFRRVRLHVRSSQPIVDTDFVAVVGVSETAATDTVENAWVPVIGGTGYNVRSPLGFRDVSFLGGAVSKYTGTPSGSGNGTLYQLTSQWVDINSIMRVDGGRPVLLYRACHVGSNGYSIFLTGVPFADETAGSWSRAVRAVRAENQNGVADLSILPPDGSNNPVYMLDVFPEYEFTVPVVSVWAVGDSITDNFGPNGWAARAVYSTSTVQRPVTLFNMGRSSLSTYTFCQAVHELLDAGVTPPSIVILPVFSPNNGYPAEQVFAQLLTLVHRLKLLGATVILWGGHPSGGAAPFDQWGQELSLSGLVIYVPMGLAVNDGANNFIPGTNYDGIHPNQVGCALMASVMAPVLGRLVWSTT